MENISSMVNFYLISTVLLIISQLVSTEIPQNIKFDVNLNQDETVQVNLVPIESFLGNEYVPVYITSDDPSTELFPVDGVMENVGLFTIYRDANTCATAVYYHNRETFCGIVGYHHVIDNLRYNARTQSVEPNDETVYRSLLGRHHERLPDGRDIITLKGDNSYIWHGSLLPLPHTVYVEILVIINYDMIFQFDNYITAATFVLEFFNNIEMIFSMVKEPNIRFNIAGILIRTGRESSPELIRESCYRKNRNGDYDLDADCVSESMRNTLSQYQTIPSRSYDVVFLLTGYRLIRKSVETETSEISWKVIEGFADMPNPAYTYGMNEDDLILGAASFYSGHQLLQVAAHEIGHMFGASHDGGPLFGDDRMCDAHLMKHNDGVCRRCFRFGGKTLGEFTNFFGSRQGCIFHNKPRSLLPQNPHLFWNEEKQCKCYGFPRASINQPHPTSSDALDCMSRLQCIAEDHQSHHTGIFMDGTPCDEKKVGTKVCWESECVPVPHNLELKLWEMKIGESANLGGHNIV